MRPHAAVELTEITDGKGDGQAFVHVAPEQMVGGEQTRLTRLSEQRQTPTSSAPQKEESDSVITRYIPPHTPEPARKPPEPDEEYTPEGSMLHRVRIYRWKTDYQYYEDFCRQAAALYGKCGEACAPAAFFSYVPQYSQMNRAQLAWYLYWRECMRRGEVIPTDYSYIMLYIFEIINLADTVDVRFGQQQLCALRRAFAATYPRLGHLLNEWICDYSLIHRLPPPPLEDLGSVSDCTLKEFYVSDTTASERYAAALISFGSNYAYTKSKFAAGENRALFDRHMVGALCACMADSGEVGARMTGAGLEESRLIRDAYTGALCSHRIKRRIEIDYCSFARSHELRILVTDIMKYTENKLRAYLGVKSRLGLYALPQTFRDCVDRYLKEALPTRARTVRSEPKQAYEALYDVPKTAISAERAAEIEAVSWHTTERLISAFDAKELMQETEKEEKCEQPVLPPDTSRAAVQADETADSLTEFSEFILFINSALTCDVEAQRTFARDRGEMIDGVADRINEIAVEVLGDIILEEGERGGYTVIEDYREIFEKTE
ncbi:MAG: TerB N-terminal domain-containing protein [Clostridia bacterium]|nr:TerB N-terminal domain-containing protein [Clostridia bacterium]